MPVYRQTYRTYEGAVRRWFRWRTIVAQELRVLFRSWAFRGLFAAGMLHVLLRMIQIMAYDIVVADEDNVLRTVLPNMELFKVNTQTFYDFIAIQCPLVFVTTILAGAGMVCNDFRHNLIEVYFSKPLTWRDYVLGKTVSLLVVGMLLTAIPALFLLALHNAFLPSMATLRDTYWWAGSILAFSCAMVFPCALGVLASSSLFRSQRFAAVAVFMVTFADLTLGTALPSMLHENDFLILAFPIAINHVGERAFQLSTHAFDLDWRWSALSITSVCLAALWIVCRRVRRAETAT